MDVLRQVFVKRTNILLLVLGLSACAARPPACLKEASTTKPTALAPTTDIPPPPGFVINDVPAPFLAYEAPADKTNPLASVNTFIVETGDGIFTPTLATSRNEALLRCGRQGRKAVLKDRLMELDTSFAVFECVGR